MAVVDTEEPPPHGFTESDYRPSACGLGGFAAIMMTIFILFIVFNDVTSQIIRVKDPKKRN